MWKFKLLIITLCLREGIFQNSCERHKNCHDCILDSSVCVWCADNDHTDNLSRCMLESKLTKDWCPETFLQRPIGNATEVRDPKPEIDDLQIKPSKYNLKLRPGQAVNFNFTFNSIKNYPVDIYFLIDASSTMNFHRLNTANQAQKIYETLRTMTENIQLGLGTFIDKNAYPYNKYILAKTCYSFRHRLTLTSNYTVFKRMVESYSSGVNVDLPEGGLDGLAQAMICKEFGWRNKSAKIVVFMTDSSYHAAGDGRVAGIFEPYDGKCYTVDGIYTKELEMDYPTIGMINKLATENDVIILFAIIVAKSELDGNGQEYEKLTEAISGSTLLKLTNSENKELINKLRDIYEQISTKIKLKVIAKSGSRKNFKITFDPDCTKNIEECKVIKNKPHNFTASITLLQYQEEDNYSLDIAVEGMTDKLSLDIDVIKRCECESTIESKSKYCNDESRQCGICVCSPGSKKYGDKCACSNFDTSNEHSTSTCINGTAPMCSDRGACECGKCVCETGYEGQFCECSSNSCPIINNALCNGHGKCECGICKCHKDYSGNACQCYLSDEECRADNNMICSNRGTCDCGQCTCNNISSWDQRRSYDKYCTMNPCSDCHNLQCLSIQPCVTCLLKTNDSCPCEGLKVDVVQNIPKEMFNQTDSQWNACTNVKVDIGCYTKFLYQYDDVQYRILVMMQLEKDCIESYYMYGGIFLISVLLIGVLTLIVWKLLSEASYRKEYIKFCKEHEADLTESSENPIYKMPTTTFRNPAFRKRSFRN